MTKTYYEQKVLILLDQQSCQSHAHSHLVYGMVKNVFIAPKNSIVLSLSGSTTRRTEVDKHSRFLASAGRCKIKWSKVDIIASTYCILSQFYMFGVSIILA